MRLVLCVVGMVVMSFGPRTLQQEAILEGMV
jgi:hypothetical protein